MHPISPLRMASSVNIVLDYGSWTNIEFSYHCDHVIMKNNKKFEKWFFGLLSHYFLNIIAVRNFLVSLVFSYDCTVMYCWHIHLHGLTILHLVLPTLNVLQNLSGIVRVTEGKSWNNLINLLMFLKVNSYLIEDVVDGTTHSLCQASSSCHN